MASFLHLCLSRSDFPLHYSLQHPPYAPAPHVDPHPPPDFAPVVLYPEILVPGSSMHAPPLVLLSLFLLPTIEQLGHAPTAREERHSPVYDARCRHVGRLVFVRLGHFVVPNLLLWLVHGSQVAMGPVVHLVVLEFAEEKCYLQVQLLL
jgi:hypothetical protein